MPKTEEERLRNALEASLHKLLSDTNRPAEAVLAQAEAEFTELLAGKELTNPGAAQFARVIREVLADARRRLLPSAFTQ